MAKLLSLLKSKIKSEEEGADRLRTIACGFLLNLTNTHGKVTLNIDDPYIRHIRHYLR